MPLHTGSLTTDRALYIGKKYLVHIWWNVLCFFTAYVHTFLSRSGRQWLLVVVKLCEESGWLISPRNLLPDWLLSHTLRQREDTATSLWDSLYCRIKGQQPQWLSLCDMLVDQNLAQCGGGDASHTVLIAHGGMFTASKGVCTGGCRMFVRSLKSAVYGK